MSKVCKSNILKITKTQNKFPTRRQIILTEFQTTDYFMQSQRMWEY